MDIIGVIPLPPARSARWRGALDAEGPKLPDGPSTVSICPARAEATSFSLTLPPGMRFTLTRTRPPSSPGRLEAEYARRRSTPSTGTTNVKNCPGAKSIGLPEGSARTRETMSSVSRTTSSMRRGRPEIVFGLAVDVDVLRWAGRATSGGGGCPSMLETTVETSRRSCSRASLNMSQ